MQIYGFLCTQEVSNLSKSTETHRPGNTSCPCVQHFETLWCHSGFCSTGSCQAKSFCNLAHVSVGVHAVHTYDFVTCLTVPLTFGLAEVAKMRAGWGDMRQSHVCPWELVFCLAGLGSTAFGLQWTTHMWVIVSSYAYQMIYELFTASFELCEWCWRDVGEKRCTQGQGAKRFPQVTCQTRTATSLRSALICAMAILCHAEIYWNISLLAQSARAFSSVGF